MTISIILYALLSTLSLLLGIFYLRIYLKLRAYQKNGAIIQFNWGPEFFLNFRKNLKKHNDAIYSYKRTHHNNPNCKVTALNIFGQVRLRFCDPIYAQEYFKNISNSYQKTMNKNHAFSNEFSGGVLFSNGKIWKKHRKLTSQFFHYELIKQRTPVILEITEEVFNQMEKSGLSKVDLLTVFQSITGQMVGRLFFGADFNKYKILGRSVPDFVADFAILLGKIQFNPLKVFLGLNFIKKGYTKLGKEYIKYFEALNEFRIEFMQAKKLEYDQKKIQGTADFTMTDHFFKQREENPDECYNDKEILDEFTTFIVGGMDTTGHLLIMTVYYLLQNPCILQKTRDEIKKVMNNGSASYNLETLNKLDYTHIVLKEVLRMNGPAFANFSQTATCDHKLDDFKVLKGTDVVVDYMGLNYSPLYHEDPYQFNPERWSDENSLTYQSVKQYPQLFTPFSSGPRSCTGQNLAIIEAKAILSRFFQRYNFKLNDQNYKLRMRVSLLYEPLEPILIDLEKKQENE